MTDPIEHLGREVARNLGDGPGPIRRDRQRAAVAHLARAAPARPRLAAWWLAPLAVAVVLAVFLARRPATLDAPVTVTVAAQAVMVGSWLAAPEHEALVLDFEGRSRAELAAGSAVRLMKADPRRIELHLERGAVTLFVHPVPGREWFVVAGPYTVSLTDADASATWLPETRTLVVDVRRGGASVADDATPTRVTAGQRLELRDTSVHAAAPPPPSLAPTTSPASPTTPSTASRPVDALPPAPRPRPPAWQTLAEAGDHAAALAAAERLGFSRLLKTLAVDDLDRLARSARFAGDGPRAREALLALRGRFAADLRAHTAAFLLGRVAVDLDHDPARAGEWFATYLSEAPDGPLAADARRRLAELGLSSSVPAKR